MSIIGSRLLKVGYQVLFHCYFPVIYFRPLVPIITFLFIDSIPTGSSAVDSTDKKQQTEAIQNIQKLAKDLFVPNKTVMSTSAGKSLYQTADLYGQVLAIENLIPMLTSNNLTLRVNALANMLHDTHDSKHEKSTELQIAADADKESYEAKRLLKAVV